MWLNYTLAECESIVDWIQQAGDDAELKVCVEFTKTAVEALLMHLNDRKSILAEYFERWKTYADTGREFRTQWKQFVTDARAVSFTHLVVVVAVVVVVVVVVGVMVDKLYC